MLSDSRSEVIIHDTITTFYIMILVFVTLSGHAKDLILILERQDFKNKKKVG